MSLTLLTPPAEEPLTLADAKAFAKIETSDDDTLVQALIVAARLHVEAATRRLLVTQSWRLALSAISTDGVVVIPVAPVQAVVAMRLRDKAGGTLLVDPAAYSGDLAAAPAALTVKASIPAGGRLEIDLALGYGAAGAVPEPLRLALRLRVAAC